MHTDTVAVYIHEVIHKNALNRRVHIAYNQEHGVVLEKMATHSTETEPLYKRQKIKYFL